MGSFLDGIFDEALKGHDFALNAGKVIPRGLKNFSFRMEGINAKNLFPPPEKNIAQKYMPSRLVPLNRKSLKYTDVIAFRMKE